MLPLKKSWTNERICQHWRESKVRRKKEVMEEAQKEGNAVHFATLMDLCHLKQKLRIGQEVPKIQRPCGSTWRPCEGRLKLERSVY